ncbi:MAG: M23 family metallopeptidase, partial [Hellea sp.]|jgi:murein DD-endopeptidase MepM/ murein hydrolase activator NlpD|nr:M23 family metallopeptidase [Hellea sp.]
VVFQLADGFSASRDGSLLPVTPRGFLVIGFHRDDTAPVILTLTDASGQTSDYVITPSIRDYDVQRIDGLNKKFVTPPDETIAQIKKDRADVIKARAMFSLLNDAVHNGFDWPSPGRITGIYGSQRILNGKPRQPHYGIDIAAAEGTPVTASADGVISMASDLYFTGGTIIIDHGYYLNSTYSHLKTMTVTEGDTVSRGQVIGTVGSTGRSTGPHLDWRINWGTKRLDPMLLSRSFKISVPKKRPEF